MKKVRSKIREIRTRKGLSQEELAKTSGVSLRTIQRVENTESDPFKMLFQLPFSVLLSLYVFERFTNAIMADGSSKMNSVVLISSLVKEIHPTAKSTIAALPKMMENSF